MTTVPVKPYKLTQATGLVDRTHWNKDENAKEPCGVWWLTGGGLSRPATDVEQDMWFRLQAAETERHEITEAYAKEIGAFA
jgi:hypothetical protein